MHIDPNDQLLIQEQQAEQLRRMQRAEQQRRQEHQQLLEDQEREEQRLLEQRQLAAQPRQERGPKGEPPAADGAKDQEQEQPAQHEGQQEPGPASSSWLKRRILKKDEDGEDGDGDDDDDEAEADHEEARQESASSSGGTGLGVGFLVIVLILAAGGSYFGYRALNGQSDDKASSIATVARPAPALPLAEPQEHRPAVVQSPGHVEPKQAEVSATAPPPALPTPSDAPTDLVQDARASMAPSDLTERPAADSVPGLAPSSNTAVSVNAGTDAQSESIQALEQRIAQLEQQLHGLRATRRQAPVSAKAPGEPSTRAAPSQAPAKPVAALPRTGSPAPARPQGQLLAIDIWDGRPSVVVGTGMPGDQRVRVLQPGESFNGISLQSVDVQAGRATFIASGGKPFTLDLHEAVK